MSGQWGKALRENWYLVALLAVVLAGAVAGYLHSGGAPVTSDVEAHMVRAKEEASAKVPETAEAAKGDDVRKVLETYRAQYEADPKAKEAPALLAAMGNLYRQKEGNYREAAQCFERLISEHPDAPGIRDAYLQLVTCYERTGDEENRRRILRQMVALYPPESQENAYASSQLYR